MTTTDQRIIEAARSAYGMQEQYWLDKVQALRSGQEDADRDLMRRQVEALECIALCLYQRLCDDEEAKGAELSDPEADNFGHLLSIVHRLQGNSCRS